MLRHERELIDDGEELNDLRSGCPSKVERPDMVGVLGFASVAGVLTLA